MKSHVTAGKGPLQHTQQPVSHRHAVGLQQAHRRPPIRVLLWRKVLENKANSPLLLQVRTCTEGSCDWQGTWVPQSSGKFCVHLAPVTQMSLLWEKLLSSPLCLCNVSLNAIFP